jgi:hypothetical protein
MSAGGATPSSAAVAESLPAVPVPVAAPVQPDAAAAAESLPAVLPDGSMRVFAKYTFADGSCYEGEWSGGKKHGQGKLTYASDGASAQYSWSAGDVYDGGWKSHQRHGAAVYTWHDGSQLACHWFEGWCEQWSKMNEAIASTKRAMLQAASHASRYSAANAVPFVNFVSDALSAFAALPLQPSSRQSLQPAAIQSPSSSPAVAHTLLSSPFSHTRHPAPASEPSHIKPQSSPHVSLHVSTSASLSNHSSLPLRACSQFLGDTITMYNCRALFQPPSQSFLSRCSCCQCLH